jgi:hypothetical protein
MDTTDKPQLVEHIHHSLTLTVYVPAATPTGDGSSRLFS